MTSSAHEPMAGGVIPPAQAGLQSNKTHQWGVSQKFLTLQQRREAAGGALNQLQRSQRGAAADTSQLQVMACPRQLSTLLTLNMGKNLQIFSSVTLRTHLLVW